MRKLIINSMLVAVAVLAAALVSSCSTEGCSPEPKYSWDDSTLGGSIRFQGGGADIDYDLSYDGGQWSTGSDYGSSHGGLIVLSSDSTARFYITMTVEGRGLNVSVLDVPLSGEPRNVTFDHVTDDAEVTFYDPSAEYSSVATHVSGYVRRVSPQPGAEAMRGEFEFQMDIECDIDGTPLELRITDRKL
ncbi:MAG TPA: hypothetical protein IAC04_08410 [Candidatus Coprenecus stercoravium]|uniref:Lipoprotein n=1 Tax=Candidatus Coprenecus stercoravium TaxID=2840735 RepID=A0A9D2GT59_9BACT|nr:hypothetical protein [Candidatus Coprenecus stercoravium]